MSSQQSQHTCFLRYITLDAAKGRKLFCVFGEAESDPQDKPIIFWMNG